MQILELIGQGGMGFVYKARQPKLDRIIALKILAQPLAEQTQFAERFTREGRTLAKLNHPNIVTIHDFGQAGPFFYLLMEYVDGVNLRQAMRAGAVNSTQALAIVPRICEALQYAHNEGVLHRDIKPDNILLDTRGRVKIADFGIAKLMAEAVAENPLTGSGASLGTPHYMAPEQIEKPNAVDHRADIYSLGVVFYEMLTGELPLGRFAAPSATSGNDPRLDEIVFQTLEKQPDRRPQSADEVRTRVETISTTPAPPDVLPEPAITFKMARCYITSPEFLATWTGRLMKYYGRGDLRLDQQNLTYAPKGNWNVIPLRAITQLTLGTSRVGMCHMKVLAVTFTEKDQTHRLYFVPNRGPLRSVYDSNDLVEEWFSAVQFAIRSATGKLPTITREDLRPTPGVAAPRIRSYFAKGVAAFLVFFTIGLVLLGAILNRRPRSPSPEVGENPIKVSQIASTNAAREQTSAAGALPQPEPLTGPIREVPLRFKGLSSASTLYFEAPIDLAFSEGILTMVRYNDGKWDHNNQSSTYRVTRGQNDARTASLFWTLPENFSFPFDVKPVLDNILDDNKTKLLRLSTNRVVELFSVTNALKQKFSCGLRYYPPVHPNVQVATITNAVIRTQNSGVEMRLYGVAPDDASLEPVAIFDTNNVVTYLTRENFGPPQVKFNVPSDFSLQPGAKLPIPEVVEIRGGERAELFSLTNSDNKVFRAFLELRAHADAPQAFRTKKADQPGGSISSNAAHKTFEFTSVTNMDDFIVLHSETPLEVGKNLIALVEDSTGKTNRAVSGTIVRHTANETHHSTQLMWKIPADGRAADWMQSTIAKIRETIVSKPLRFAEGETMRLFPLRTTPGSVEQFAAIRYESVQPSHTEKSATVRVRSASAYPSGLIFNFDADVPPGYRLEALCDPKHNGAEARMNLGNHGSGDHYSASWHYDNLRGQNLADLQHYLKSAATGLTHDKFAIDAGQSKTIFKFKATSGDEFPVILKLRSPYER